jgi:LuxR family transcriptional regulator, maltose regulon positive regulatory protein
MEDSQGDRIRPMLPAKLTRPGSRGVLPRKRLFEAMEKDPDNRVIWISGPAGSGKTTLATSYLDSRNMELLWYQLDEGDSDIATFFYYLGLGAKHSFPEEQKSLPLFTPEYMMGVPVFARRFFEQLSRQLTEKAHLRHSSTDGKSAIVLDNYQDIPETSMLHHAINAGISSLPENVKIIILSREDPPAAYARLRATREMTLLGWDHLRLTAEESDGVARLRRFKDLDRDTLTLLHQTTDGWAAGLVLLLEKLGFQGSNFELHRSFERHEIFGYFASELFDKTPLEMQNFLLETAFFPKITTRMAEELTGNPRAGRIFSDLSRKNYFTTRHIFSEQVFQYHPLFREFLEKRARELTAPERLIEIKRRAAKVLEANGHAEDAIHLFCETGEWADAVRVILTLAPLLTAQGRWQTLQSWIESLPPPLTETLPWLAYWMGVCRLPTSPSASSECFAKAFESFRKDGDAAGSFLALSGMIDAITHRMDRFGGFDPLVSLMSELMGEYPSFPLPVVEWRVTNSMLYALMLRQPNHPDFERWADRGLELAMEIPDTDLAVRILCALAFHYLLGGELAKVKLVLDSFQKRLETTDANPVALLIQKDLEVFFYWLSADFQRHRKAVEDGIALAENTGIHVVDMLLLGHSASGALSVGDVAKAQGYIDKMFSFLRMGPSVYGEYFYHNMMAWKCFLEGQQALASMHADLALEKGAASGSPQVMPTNHLIKAMVMHELGNDEEALLHISECLGICRTIKLYQLEFMGFLVKAKFAFDVGNIDEGRESLRRGLAIGIEHGYATGYLWVDSIMASLCLRALEADIETAYVRDLVRRRNLMPDEPVLHVESWPWPFQIHTLGSFRMLNDGKAVKFSGKVQRKPLLLLKALISFGGRDVKEEMLSDALWPDADGDLAHRSFSTTLHRLRRLVGLEPALSFTDGKLTIDPHFCWVDAFVLEQLLDEAEALWKAGLRHSGVNPPRHDRSDRAIRLTQKVISMYGGHFLDAEVEQPWMVSPRERLRARYLQGVENLGAYWKRAGDMDRAVHCFEKALQVDDLAEETYGQLITCYQCMGLDAKAHSVYRRYRTVIGAKLGIEPSPRIEALLKKTRH